MKPSPRIRSARQQGFSLIELLLSLSMFSVAGLIAIRLFDQSMHVIHASAQDPVFQLDQMGQMLRADVWAAKQIQITGGKTVDLTSGDGKRIRWQWDSQQISRTQFPTNATESVTTSSRQWTAPVVFTAERADHALVLRANTDQWRFIAPMVPEGLP